MPYSFDITATATHTHVKVNQSLDGTPYTTVYFAINGTEIIIKEGKVRLVDTKTNNSISMPRSLIVPLQANDTAAEVYFSSILFA